jgi:hypothetical protein
MPRSTSSAATVYALILAAGGSATPVALAEAKHLKFLRVELAHDGQPILTLVTPGRPGQNDQDGVEPAPEPPLLPITRDLLDRVIYGSHSSDAARRAGLDALLEAKIADSSRGGPLPDHQVRALRLAAAGDIKYLLDRAEKFRAALDDCDKDVTVLIGRDELVRLAESLRPIRTAFSHGPFGDGSYFDKVLRTIRRRARDAEP